MARQNGKKFRASAATDANGKGWIAHELAGCEFHDVRLTKRFAKLFRQLSDGVGKSIPWACQDWTSTKAGCRFFANGRVSESAILGATSKPHYLARANDPPPGNMVAWRDLSRLADIHHGFLLASRDVGS